MLQQHVVDLQQQRSQPSNHADDCVCVCAHVFLIAHTLTEMLVNLWGQIFIWHFHNSHQIHVRRRLILVAASRMAAACGASN